MEDFNPQPKILCEHESNKYKRNHTWTHYNQTVENLIQRKSSKNVSQRKTAWELPKEKETRLTQNFALETMEITG